MEKEQFAEKVRAWRKRIRLSQAQAALALDVNINTLQNWEIARSMPRGLGLALTLDTLENYDKPPDPDKIKAALYICRVLKRYAEDNRLPFVVKHVAEITRLLK